MGDMYDAILERTAELQTSLEQRQEATEYLRVMRAVGFPFPTSTVVNDDGTIAFGWSVRDNHLTIDTDQNLKAGRINVWEAK